MSLCISNITRVLNPKSTESSYPYGIQDILFISIYAIHYMYTVYSIQYTLYCIQYTLYTGKSIRYNAYCIMYSEYAVYVDLNMRI